MLLQKIVNKTFLPLIGLAVFGWSLPSHAATIVNFSYESTSLGMPTKMGTHNCMSGPPITGTIDLDTMNNNSTIWDCSGFVGKNIILGGGPSMITLDFGTGNITEGDISKGTIIGKNLKVKTTPESSIPPSIFLGLLTVGFLSKNLLKNKY